MTHRVIVLHRLLYEPRSLEFFMKNLFIFLPLFLSTALAYADFTPTPTPIPTPAPLPSESAITSNPCGEGSLLTAYGCLAQGPCPMGYAYYEGICITGADNTQSPAITNPDSNGYRLYQAPRNNSQNPSQDPSYTPMPTMRPQQVGDECVSKYH